MAAIGLALAGITIGSVVWLRTHRHPSARPQAQAVAKKTTTRPKAHTSAAMAPLSRKGDSTLMSSGHRYFKSGDYADAEDAYRQALDQDKSAGEPRFWLAMAQTRQGKDFRACRNFEKYIDNFPVAPHAGDARKQVVQCQAW